MTQLNDLQAAEFERGGGPHERYCDCCDQPETEDNPLVSGIAYGIETTYHSQGCPAIGLPSGRVFEDEPHEEHKGTSYKPGHSSDIPF